MERAHLVCALGGGTRATARDGLPRQALGHRGLLGVWGSERNAAQRRVVVVRRHHVAADRAERHVDSSGVASAAHLRRQDFHDQRRQLERMARRVRQHGGNLVYR